MTRVKNGIKTFRGKLEEITYNFNSLNLWFLAFLFPIFLHLTIFAPSTKIIWALTFLALFVYLLLIKPKVLILALVLVCFYVAIIIQKELINVINYSDEEYMIKGKVIKASEKYFLIQIGNKNVLVFQNQFNTKDVVHYGYILEVKGTLVDVKNSELNFEKTFLLQNDIKYFLKNSTIETIYRQSFSLEDKIHQYANENGYYFQRYWRLMIFGEYDYRIDVLDKVNNLNIIHLIVISGFHFDVLFLLLFWICKPLKKLKVDPNKFVFVLAFFYLTFLNSPISGLRAYIMQVVKKSNNKSKYKYSQKFKKYDGFCIALFIIFCLNFNNVFSIGFIMSFLNTLMIMFLYSFVQKFKKLKKVYAALIVGILVYLFALMFVFKINKNWNIFALIFIFIFSPIIEFYYLCSILFWWSPTLLNYMYMALDWLINLALKISVIVKINFNIPWVVLILWTYLWFSSLCFIAYKKDKKIKQVILL